MLIIKYETEEEATEIKEAKINEGYTLVEVSNITEGNFLGFQEPGWIPPVHPTSIESRMEELKQENALLKAQNNDLSDRADFIEDVIAEMATHLYQ